MNLSYIFVVFLLQIAAGRATERHMVCKEYGDIFGKEIEIGSTTSGKLQGPPGKKGPVGPRGVPGNPGVQGKPGVVDYGKVKEILKQEFRTEWCLQAFNGVPYNATCLWAEHVSPEFHLRNTDALAICNKRALSKLPDVYNEKEFDEITQYMRSKIPPSNKGRVLAWTGMKRDHSTGKALLSNGDPALYTKPNGYQPEWETASPTSTTVYLSTNNARNGGGMGALRDSYAFINQPKIVLCQKI